MKIQTTTRTTVSGIALTKKEIETLEKAQEIVDKLWDELEEVDTIEGSFCNIYNAIDTIGNYLNYIADSVDIQEYLPE